MIVEVIATYHGTQDMVQCAALVLEPSGESLHGHLKSAHVALLHNRVPILTKNLERADYNEGENQFMIFFLHPPIQRDMYVEFAVELTDGRTGRAVQQVSNRENLPNVDVATNPMLPGLPVKDRTNTWDGLGRERKPD